MMRRNNTRGMYFSAPDMLGVTVTYYNGDLTMILFMSAKPGGLASVERNLNNAEFRRRLKAMQLHDLDLAIPRFSSTQEYSLAATLQRLGIVNAFDASSADFSGMETGARKGLYLKDAVHKAFVDVNERGTEVAAATSLRFNLSAPPKGTFHADRPFVFVIQESTTGSILFMGRVSDPRQ